MRAFILLLVLSLAAACATPPPTEVSPAALRSALHADLLDGGSIDLNADLEAGRSVALVFWQSW